MNRQTLSRVGLLSAGLAALRTAVVSAAGSRNGLSAPLASDREKVAHLLRRAGFGFSQDDLDLYAQMGVGGAVDYLLDYDQVPDDVEDRLAGIKLNLYNANDLQRWWLLRMIYTKRPLLEKMTLFWHGLLVSGYSKVGLPQVKEGVPDRPSHMLNQIQFFREHALDDHASIMKGISRDPAMVIYLDSRDNRRGSPNENYAREVMELFTLGIYGPDGTPNYTEQDVREAAKAFTGWGLNREQQFAFNPGQHDTSRKTVLGTSGSFNGDDVIDLIMAHPSAPYYISNRIFSYFAYDDPEPEVLAPVVQAYQASGGSIRAVVRAVLTSPALFSERAYRAKVKSPVEFVAGMARALKLQTDALNYDGTVRRMGQTLLNPPNVAGWPGGVQWFNTTTWLERVNYLNRILTLRKDDHTQPISFLSFVQQNKLTSPEAAADYFLGLLLDGQVRPEQRQSLIAYLRDGVNWPSSTAALKDTDPPIDRKIRGLVYLIMAMPEYELA